MTQRTILDVDWIVLEETTPPPADEPLTISAQPSAAPEPVVIASRSGEAIYPPALAVRPWAKPLLTGSLVLSVVWLAAMMITIIEGALFADPMVRLSLVLAGVPIIYLLAVAMLADPHRNIGDDIYQAFNPVGPCTPTRANTLTGSDHRR